MKLTLILISIAISFTSLAKENPKDELFPPCLKCDLDGVKAAVAAGADVNELNSTSGQSALAYSYHCPDVIEYLLEQGADPNKGAVPPLYSAATIAAYDVMKMLLDAGADPNLKGNNESIVFKIVQMTNCADCADLLFSNGADNTSTGGVYTNLVGVYASYGKSQADRLAEMKRYGDILKSYTLAIPDSYYAPSEQINAPPAEMLKVLVKNGIDINARTKLISSPPNDGEPPLFTAMNLGNKEVILSILENGCDFNAQYFVYNPALALFNFEGGGYTPLMYASLLGYEWMVEKLIANPGLENPTFGASFITEEGMTIDIKGMSAIYLAIMSGNTNVVKMLAESTLEWGDFELKMKGKKFEEGYGSKPNAYQFGGFSSKMAKKTLRYSPSLYAAFSEKPEMEKILIANKL